MTMVRTALRLVTCHALQGTVGARPTIAENRIFDSRLGEIEPETFQHDARAIVVITTDQDEGEQLSKNNGGPPFKRWIDLTLEMGMVARVKAEDDEDAYVVGYPDTDARLEASLDLLEYQVIRRLAYDLSAASNLFRDVAIIRKSECHRQVEDGAGIKMAARVLTLSCDCGDDDERVLNSNSVQPTGLDVLPDPLRTVAKALPAGSSGRGICETIAASLQPLTAPPLEGIDIIADAGTGSPVPRVNSSAEFPQI